MFIVVCIGNLHYESGKLSVNRLTWVLPYITGALFKWTSNECHFRVHTLLSSWASKFHDSVSWPFPLFHDFKFSCHLWKLSKLFFFRGILGQKKSVQTNRREMKLGPSFFLMQNLVCQFFTYAVMNALHKFHDFPSLEN